MPGEHRENALLKVEDLQVGFPIRGGVLRRTQGEIQAVAGVSFSLEPGQTLGLVGESGCGKSTLAKAIVGLENAKSGRMLFEDLDLTRLDKRRRFLLRREIQMVMQDPYSSLNPRMSARNIVIEAWSTHPDFVPKEKWCEEADRLLERVGIDPDSGSKRPHEFSGGQRQRISIARALALRPRLLICDEPTSALDVSVQAQILNLLMDLQRDFGLSMLFISHDLAVVRQIADRVAVMYLGKIVEEGSTEELYTHPVHPYTQALLSAIPPLESERRSVDERIALRGVIPSPTDPPSGCRFRTRCWKAEGLCAEEEPDLSPRGFNTLSACHFAEDLTEKSLRQSGKGSS